MKEKLAKLIDVKTIVTFSLIMVYNYLAIMGKITPEIYGSTVITVIAFYFGTQNEKNKKVE